MKKKHILVAVGGSLLLCAGLVAFTSKHSIYERHVCLICGVEKEKEERSLGGVAFPVQEAIYPTAISKVLDHDDCTHEWLRYWFASSHGQIVGGWTEIAHGGSRSGMVQYLIRDETLAEEISQFPDSSAAWHSLILAIEEDEDTDSALAQWWVKGLERKPFAAWWTENVEVGGIR